MDTERLIKDKRAILVCVVLLALSCWIYAQTLRYDFVNYDDDVYAYANPAIKSGLTISSIGWAFAHFLGNNWHPLTAISHMLDCQLFGMNAGAHHLTNLLLHSAAAVLLFLALVELTRALWPSAFVAAVFAVHPLHVESVAWISERKDVLSGLFFALTLGAYAQYVRRPTVVRYVVVAVFFSLGLMSKPMLVTVPLILLLLDSWPLNRGHMSQVTGQEEKTISWLIVEKVPLLILSAAVSITTWFAQKGAMPRFELLPLGDRAANALMAFLIYVWQMIWPVNLALVYPRPEHLPIWQVVGACVLLITITLASIAFRKRYPYFMVGWFCYVIMLVPVIGLVQVGGQAHADRYTYLPQIGLYIAVTWGFVDLVRAFHVRREIVVTVAAIVIVAFSSSARAQTKYWRNSETLWRHTLAVTLGKSDVAHFYLGEYLLDHNRTDEAITELRAVLAGQHPDDSQIHLDLGNAFLQKDQRDQAMAEFRTALKIDPNDSDAETALAKILLDLGRGEEALGHFRNVIWLHPTSAAAHYNLGRALYRLHRLSDAINHYQEALAIDPDFPGAAASLTELLLQTKQSEDERFRPKKP